VTRVQPFEQIEHPLSRCFIQIAGWFIGQKQPWIVNQGSRQRHTLLFTARKFAGAMVCPILQTNLPEPICSHRERLLLPPPRGGFTFRSSLLFAACQQRHGHVFQRRKLRQQVMKLPHVADLPIAKGCGLSRAQLGHMS